MLFPIRIDAWSADRTIRVVDTFLYDPSAPDEGMVDPFQMAYQLIADAEVMGMGRTARHYTNRVELYKPDLHREVTRQIQEQTEEAKQKHRSQQLEAVEGQHSAIATRKKRRDRAAAIAELTMRMTKKSKVENSTSSSSEDVSGSGNANEGIEEKLESKGDKAPAGESETSKVDTATSTESAAASAPAIGNVEPKLASRDAVASTCKHVRLRLAAYGVRIHDDFFLDPNHDEDRDGMGPIRIARQLGDDLNLSVELVQAIAIEIHEQLHGRGVLDDELMLAGGDDGQPPPEILRDKDNVTAAWTLDQRVHITNVAHLVSHHRPNVPTSSGVASSSTAT